MKIQCALFVVVASLVVGTNYARPCAAQQVRYMDSSGNIHFVDNVNKVPQRYREQVMTPTPVPVLDRKALAEKRRQEQQVLREKKAEERRKQSEERIKKREEAKQKADEAKKNRRKGLQSGFGRVL
jgi:type IV secretory pathway VirB10-like protein